MQMPDETRKKISASKKGRPQAPEHTAAVLAAKAAKKAALRNDLLMLHSFRQFGEQRATYAALQSALSANERTKYAVRNNPNLDPSEREKALSGLVNERRELGHRSAEVFSEAPKLDEWLDYLDAWYAGEDILVWKLTQQ